MAKRDKLAAALEAAGIIPMKGEARFFFKKKHRECVYLCMYVYMYACMHACMYACMHVCMHVCMYACMHVCMHVCMYACMHVCMYVQYCGHYLRRKRHVLPQICSIFHYFPQICSIFHYFPQICSIFHYFPPCLCYEGMSHDSVCTMMM
jgi:hypothetical protein